MRKFEPGPPLLKKKSPLALKKPSDAAKAAVDVEDNASDQTDGGSEHLEDVIDNRSNITDATRTKAAIDHLKHKIEKIKLNIKTEQESKEENVNEYLRLTNETPDKSAVQRHKNVFEKHNQRSAANIAQLQRKLEVYQKRVREIELHGLSAHKPAKDIIKDVSQGLKDFGGNLKDGVLGLSGTLVAKPRDLLMARSKFGSADNINSLPKVEPLSMLPGLTGGTRREREPSSPTTSSTLPSNLKMTFHDDVTAALDKLSSMSDDSYTRDSPRVNGHSDAMSCSQPVVQPALFGAAAEPAADDSGSAILEVVAHVTSELDILKQQYSELQEEFASVKQTVEEERYRCERLEEHLNDMAELYQNELANLKQEVANMEEKLEYQLEERTRDMHEALESCHTKISKMELQNQHQQLISMEGVDNATAKVLATKLINVVLAILAIILFFISTVSSIINPFINNRWKTISLIIVVVAVVVAVNHWDRLKTMLPYIPSIIKRA